MQVSPAAAEEAVGDEALRLEMEPPFTAVGELVKIEAAVVQGQVVIVDSTVTVLTAATLEMERKAAATRIVGRSMVAGAWRCF